MDHVPVTISLPLDLRIELQAAHVKVSHVCADALRKHMLEWKRNHATRKQTMLGVDLAEELLGYFHEKLFKHELALESGEDAPPSFDADLRAKLNGAMILYVPINDALEVVFTAIEMLDD